MTANVCYWAASGFTGFMLQSLVGHVGFRRFMVRVCRACQLEQGSGVWALNPKP